ncbi:MAG: hypothetical protein GTN76_08600, partial [Candidatus Aenigmarchaeota archaeon]|nr:hypothetical protein [Candidatus Aenigmarchaeota archaeon]
METIDKPKGAFSKRDILYLLFKRKSLILYIFFLTTGLVTIGCYIIPLKYETFSEVYIKRNIPPIPFLSATYFARSLERRPVISTAVELIKSKAVIEKAADILISRGEGKQKEKRVSKSKVLAKLSLLVKSVNRKKNDLFISLGLIPQAGRREQMISRIKKIEVKPIVSSDIIKINYKHINPKFAADVVNTVVKVYLEQHLELIKRPGTYEFYDDQTKESEAIIRKLEDKIRSFKEQRSIISVEDQKRLKLEELSSLRTILNQTRGEKTEISKKIETLKNQILRQSEKVIGSKAIKRNPQIDHLNAKLLDLEIEKFRLLQRFNPQYQKIRDIDTTIKSIQRKLSQESLKVVDTETVISNTIRQGLVEVLQKSEADLNAKVVRELMLTEQIEELEEELQQLDKYAVDLKALAETKDSAEKSLLRYINHREEARVAGATN